LNTVNDFRYLYVGFDKTLFIMSAIYFSTQSSTSVIHASDFGVSSTASAQSNATNLNTAIASASLLQTALLLPAGDIQFSSDIVLPVGFTGSIGIFGIADKITRLVPVGGCNGINFDLSAGIPANNSVRLRDFGLVAGSGVAGTALRISYGTASLGSVESQPGSKITDISIYGGGWTNGALFENCWHLRSDNFYVFGNESSYNTSALGSGSSGPGSGRAIEVLNCINCTFGATVCEFFSQGIVPVGNCQGIFFDDVQMVECIEGFHAYGTPGGYMGTIELTNWMVDNGNLNVAGHASVIFENCSNAYVSIGQGLQNGGVAPNISMINCKHSWIQDNSLEFRANTTGPDILISGSSTGIIIDGNTLGGNLVFSSDTSGNFYGTNLNATVIDNGNNSSMYPAAPAKLINISTRGYVGTGVNVMIAGFVISGTNPMQVLIRATGPTLAQFGVTGVLPDPKLSLTTAAGVTISSNTIWGGSSQIANAASSVGAFAWPATSKDSALLVTLQPGNYTAIVSGASGDTGDALVEVYLVS
jgi:hypothetical protein